MRRKKTTNLYAEEERWVFSFDLKQQSEDECLTERGREFHIPDPMKGTDERNEISEYLRLSEDSEKLSRDEATLKGMGELYQRQCGSRLELFCVESSC